MSTEAFAVVNPVAGGGRVGATWSTLSEALRQAGLQFQAQLTGRPGDGTPITRKAIAEGDKGKSTQRDCEVGSHDIL